jgi:dolichyl-phosphate-mannose-protein mannosyltransferase
VRLLNRPAVVILAVGLLAGGLRFWHLSSPADRIFDEVYYPKAGCILVGGTDAQCDVQSSAERYWRDKKWDVGSWTHPPLGKWMIGLGEKAFGFDSFGWRFSSATVGTLTVMAVALIAYLLFGSALWAAVAGLLMSVDGLSFVLSRTGLLDSFVAFWVTLGFLFLVLDRRWIDLRTPSERPAEESDEGPAPSPDEADAPPRPWRPPSPIWRPWRFAAGIAFGAAISTKWSGALALIAAGLLTVMWETTRRRSGGVTLRAAIGRTVLRETFGLVLAFLLLPAAIYLVVYLPWFHHFGWSLAAWRHDQAAIWNYHKSLQWFDKDTASGTMTPTHPWLSHAWTWLPMQRPVLFYARYPGDDVRWITALGNPAIFWGAFWTLPYTTYSWWRRRDWRAGLILVAFAVQYFPWFAVSRPQFLFYMTPMVPFLVLGAVYTARDFSDMVIEQRDPQTGAIVERSRLHPYRPFVWGYLAAAVALFVWFYPVLTGGLISRTAWHLRLWMRSWS